MPNEDHFAIIKRGVTDWNEWRLANPETKPHVTIRELGIANLRNANLESATLDGALMGADLRQANLRRATLSGAYMQFADLSQADLTGANFSGTNLEEANLEDALLQGTSFLGANLSSARLDRARGHAKFIEANLSDASLIGCDFRILNLLGGADFSRANLKKTNLTSAILMDANFEGATLIETVLDGANISDAFVYGSSVWNISTVNLIQRDLRITPMSQDERDMRKGHSLPYPSDTSKITVDNLEVAQFIYLILNNQKIRDVINTITSKAVLILGRFTPGERKDILIAMKEKLRQMNFLPIVFDFEKPTNRDFTETLMTLTGMSLFVIADITNPKSSPLELQATVPNYMVPFVPILHEGETPFSMFADLQNKYGWVLDVRTYDTQANLIRYFEEAIVKPALDKHDQLLANKMENMRSIKITEVSTRGTS
jgi:uncharacterized protein YjbI with pentapeptide repeats